MKYYKTIDELPIWNFYEVKKQGDLKYLCKTDDYTTFKVPKLENKKLLKVWEGIVDQYMETVVITDELHLVLLKKKEVAILKSKYVREKKSIYKSLYLKAERELNELLVGDGKVSTLEDQVFSIEKYMGFQVEVKKLSTRKFFSYINNINKAVKEQLKQQKNG